MSLYSSYERKERDLYETHDFDAVYPLLPHIEHIKEYCEPCAASGILIEHLAFAAKRCTAAYDIQPLAEGIVEKDATTLTRDDLNSALTIITNPPWSWPVLKLLLMRFAVIGVSAWLLLESSFSQNVRSAPFMKRCERIVPVGRVYWEPNTEHKATFNVAWFFFRPDPVAQTTSYPRVKR